MLRKETRQAEFLVHQRIPISLIRNVAVYSGAAEARVRAALQQMQWEVPVKVVPAWYY